MLKRIQRIVQAISRVVQKVLTMALLILLYVAGLGMTSLFLKVFRRELLFKRCALEHAGWNEASGYAPDEEEASRQA